MIFSFFNKRFLGIDLGSINIKVVEGIKTRNQLEITNFGVIPIVNFKEILSSSYILEENLASVLRDFIKETKMQAKNVFFNVPAPYIFSSTFFVPNIPEKNLPQVIRFESQKQIPLSLDEIEIEYSYLQTENENQLKQWLVFLSAVPKSHFKKIENLCSLTNLKFGGYSFEHFNIEPYFWKKSGNFIIVDLGHSYSSLVLLKEGKIIYVDKLKIRGYDFLDSIMNLTNYPENQVLDLVLDRGFNFNPEEKELKDLVNNFLNSISSTVENEIHKLENNFLLNIEKIYWTGGLCILKGFKEKIIEKLSSYQNEILSPSDFVVGEKFQLLKEKSTIFSQAVGILMRKFLR